MVHNGRRRPAVKAWKELSEHDRAMIGAAKRADAVTVQRPNGPVVATLLGWTPRTNRPTARVRFSTGGEATVPGATVALILWCKNKSQHPNGETQ